MDQRDYYEILGVPRSAASRQIKSAYRRLAREYHPDVNKSAGAAGKFKEATAAYEVLSDPAKRKTYDQFGHAGGGFPGSGRGGPGAGRAYTWTSRGGEGPDMSGFDFEDLFSASPFRGMSLDDLLAALGGRRRWPKRSAESARPFGVAQGRPEPVEGRQTGPDAESHITLDFMQAVKGCTTTLQLRRPDGRIEQIDLKIPPGVREGSKVRLRGKGGAGPFDFAHGKPAGAGDLYIITHIREHPCFRREGADIYMDLPISVAEAALGGEVTVPTIDGQAVVKVPSGTSGRTRLRLRGKGVADPKTGKRGDQYVVVKIVLPKKISEKGSQLLREFSQTDPYDPRERAPW